MANPALSGALLGKKVGTGKGGQFWGLPSVFPSLVHRPTQDSWRRRGEPVIIFL